MTNTIKRLIATALVFIAILIHAQYIDYGASDHGQLITLSPASGKASKLVRDKLMKPVLAIPDEYILEQLDETRAWASELVDAQTEADVLAAVAAAESAGPADADAAKAAADSKRADAKLEELETTSAVRARELRLAQVAELAKRPVYFGLLPAKDLGGSARLQRRDAFWIGIIAPLSLIFVALVLFFLPSSSTQHRLVNTPPSFSPKHPETPAIEPSMLRDLLKKDFDIDFPISGGTGNSRDTPVVVHRVEPNDYTSVEYGVIRCIMTGRGVEWKRTQQSVLHHNGRTLDQLKIEITNRQTEEIVTTVENYYFDITACVDF